MGYFAEIFTGILYLTVIKPNDNIMIISNNLQIKKLCLRCQSYLLAKVTRLASSIVVTQIQPSSITESKVLANPSQGLAPQHVLSEL